MIKSFNRIRGSLVVWVTSYIFFLLTLANNFSASHDSMNYLDGIVNGEHMFHQHHLLYHFLSNQWLHLWKWTGVPQYYIIESFTALWGSSVLSLTYLFFRNRFYLSKTLSMLGVSVIAFSYGVWFYSVNIEVYTPPLFFVLLCLYLITRKTFTQSHVRQVAVLHSMAILFHQVNVLFTVVLVYAIISNRKNLDQYRSLFQYVLIGSAITGGMYFIAGWIVEGHDSMQAWIHWMRGYTTDHGYWQPPGISTPLHVITGFSHAFVGGHYLFQLPAVEQYLQGSFQAHGLKDEVFLSKNISPLLAWILTGITVVFGFLFISLAVRFFARYSVVRLHSKVLQPLLLCLIVYSVFFCFWTPEILEFWILQMVIVWLLLIGMLPLIRFPFNIPLRTGLFVLSLSIFLVNYFGSIRWLQDINNDWYYAEVQKLIPDLQKDDLVIVKDGWVLKYYIIYYTEAEAVSSEEEIPDKKRKRIFIYRDGRLTLSD